MATFSGLLGSTMPNLPRRITQTLGRQEGAALVEYGLLIAVVAVLCVGTVAMLGTSVQGLLAGAAAI